MSPTPRSAVYAPRDNVTPRRFARFLLAFVLAPALVGWILPLAIAGCLPCTLLAEEAEAEAEAGDATRASGGTTRTDGLNGTNGADGTARTKDGLLSPKAVLPASIDLRPLFDGWGLDRRVQGHRNTCSVFVVTGAVEFALAKAEGRGTRLSVEYLNWASDVASGEKEDGSFFSDLWDGFAVYGAADEGDMPYQPSFDPDRKPTAETIEKAKRRLASGLEFHWIKRWNPERGIDGAELAEVRRALASGWPVCGGFLWPKSDSWDDDVLRIVPRESVRDGHSVLLVGYRDDAKLPGGGVVIVRNSSRGGKDGYLTYEYLKEYMNDASWISSTPAGEPAPPARASGRIRFGGPASARVASSNGLLSPLVPPPTGRPRRVSSNEQPAWNDGDDDMKMLPPGASVEMPLLEGPGLITHIWFTSHAGWVGELDGLVLRIVWDGRAEPAVEVPLGDFFAVGQGRPAPVESFPVQVSPSGSLSCYWRMPFEKSARITVTNDNPDRAAGLYWQVDWIRLAALPRDTPYFHARFRREHPAEKGRDYRIADIEGRGYYAGTVLSTTLAQDGWFGEGDDFFRVDGEEVPSLQGTGTEDYFNDAWGYRPRTSLWFGQPRWQGDRAGDSGVSYRWHLLDPIAFEGSLRLDLEHKGNRDVAEDGFYLERPDFFSSVAFWYQTGEPKPWERLPPYPERRVPWTTRHLVKAFRAAETTGKAKPRVETEGLFGARPILTWPTTEVGCRLTLPFALEVGGRYAVRLTAAGGPDRGRHTVEIDGKPVLSEADFRTPEAAELDLTLGTHLLEKGSHTISFLALETSPAKAGPLSVESLRFLRLPAEATRGVKTENEAHFVRLAIGRAVYAYRLAYDALPESLEALVASGILSERYLEDENRVRLVSSREGEEFVVESKGPGAWTHRWKGLDARR